MIALALALLPATGYQLPADTTPRLVVVLSVDQFRGDYLDKYGPQLSGGLARLAREGAVFTNAHQDHAMTSTAAGHASVTTGRYPYSTGIVRNNAGTNDPSHPLVGASGSGSSPRRLRGTTVFDWMKARWPSARALGAGGDDRNVIPLVGREREQVYWSVSGQFVTSTYYRDSLPGWVHRFNREAWPIVSSTAHVWNLAMPEAAYPEPDSVPWENRGADFTFPHRGASAGDTLRAARWFRYTPWGDSLTLAFVLRGTAELGLGRGEAPDLIAIGLATADDIGHAYGPESRELRDYYVRLDRWLDTFLDSLQRLSGGPLIVVLTADHGVTPFPEGAWARGDSAWHVRLDTTLNRWQTELQEHLGEGRYILWASSGMIAVDRQRLERAGARPDTVIARIAADLARLPGVARVQTRADLARRADTTSDAVTRRWRRTVEPGSPAEIFVTLRPGSAFTNPLGSAQHGQNSDLDAHVTLVLWGHGVRPGRYDRKAAVVDIAPTLARILGLRPAERVDGRVLTEAIQ